MEEAQDTDDPFTTRLLSFQQVYACTVRPTLETSLLSLSQQCHVLRGQKQQINLAK